MDDDRLRTCPRCGKTGHFHYVEIEERNSGAAMLLFGGVWAYLLSRSNSDNMVVCDHCHYVFKERPPFGKDDLIGWTAIFIALVIAGAAIYFAVH
jgi:rubredoxin